MILELTEIFRKGSKDYTDTIQLPRVVEENVQVEKLEPIDVSAHAVAEDGICQVDSGAQSTVSYICSRCLRVFPKNLKTNFTELFSQRAVSDDEVELVDEEVEFDPYVEQAINLALDPKPLCDEDCRGLCPQCGVNLNETTCNCQTEQIDPRLEVLKGLLSEDDSE